MNPKHRSQGTLRYLKMTVKYFRLVFSCILEDRSKHTESHQAFKIAEGGALLTQLSDEGFENLKPDISLALALELAFWM